MALTKNTFKKILVASLAVFVLGVLGITGYVRYFQMYFMSEEYPMWIHQMEVVATPTQERLVVLGDSRSKAGYQPSLTEIQTINLSCGGISPVGSYYVLKKYLSVAPAPEKIVISFAPFVLLEMSGFRTLFWERSVKYSLLDREDLKEVSSNARRLGDETFGDVEWNYFRFSLPDKRFDDLRAGSLFMRGEANREIYHHAKTHRGHSFFKGRHAPDGHFREVDSEDFIHSKMLKYYLNETIRLAQSNDIEVYWYTVPFNQGSKDALSPVFQFGFDAFLGELSREMGVTVINGITFIDNDHFGDPSHIKGGVKKVTFDLLHGVGLSGDAS
jgi:hypothetical protein